MVPATDSVKDTFSTAYFAESARLANSSGESANPMNYKH